MRLDPYALGGCILVLACIAGWVLILTALLGYFA